MKKYIAILLLLGTAWPVTAMAAASCTIVRSAGNILANFGSYDAMSGPRDSIGQVSFTCVPDALLGVPVSYSVAASPGNSGSYSQRRLQSGAYGLNYNLYLDPSRLQVFGDGSPGTSKSAGICAAACVVPVYGRLSGGQTVPAGTYQDSILVTLEF